MAQFVTKDPLTIRETDYPEQVDLHPTTDRNVGETIVGDADLDQADGASTISLQIWLSHSPWRITAGWSAIAGALSLGLLSNLHDWRLLLDWQMIALALLLVDPLWSSIWRFAWGREGLLPLGKQQQASKFWLPYLKADSPAGRMLGIAGWVDGRPNDGAIDVEHSQNGASTSSYHTDFAPTLFRVGLPTLLLAFGVAVTLHSTAVWFTAAVVACSIFGWLARRTSGKPSTLLQIIVSVTFPWVLIVYLLDDQFSQGQIEFVGFELRIFFSFCLIALWTIHSWGIALARRRTSLAQNESINGRNGLSVPQLAALQRDELQTDSMGLYLNLRDLRARVTNLLREPSAPLLVIADVGMIVLILVLREPLWLAILTPLWLPTWFAYLQSAPVDRQPLWRLAAFLVSAIVVGQTPLI